MELSKRPYTVASAVSPGCRVADISDHGYIPIYLVKNKYAPRAFAMDVNQGPLERAREHIQEEGLTSQIETRLSNGLLQLEPEEVDAVVIAGMGGILSAVYGNQSGIFTDRQRTDFTAAVGVV